MEDFRRKRETEGTGATKLSHMQQRLMATDRTGSRQTGGGAGTQGRLLRRKRNGKRKRGRRVVGKKADSRFWRL